MYDERNDGEDFAPISRAIMQDKATGLIHATQWLDYDYRGVALRLATK